MRIVFILSAALALTACNPEVPSEPVYESKEFVTRVPVKADHNGNECVISAGSYIAAEQRGNVVRFYVLPPEEQQTNECPEGGYEFRPGEIPDELL